MRKLQCYQIEKHRITHNIYNNEILYKQQNGLEHLEGMEICSLSCNCLVFSPLKEPKAPFPFICPEAHSCGPGRGTEVVLGGLIRTPKTAINTNFWVAILESYLLIQLKCWREEGRRCIPSHGIEAHNPRWGNLSCLVVDEGGEWWNVWGGSSHDDLKSEERQGTHPFFMSMWPLFIKPPWFHHGAPPQPPDPILSVYKELNFRQHNGLSLLAWAMSP